MIAPPALLALLGQDYAEQAPVTNWPARIGLTVAVLVITGWAVWAMARSWRRRQARQAWVQVPPPPQGFAPAAQYPGRYVATVRTDDWLDRVAAAGLGFPGDATIGVGSAGVLVDREGAAPIFLPAARIVEVSTARGMAQEVYERDGLVAITWDGAARPEQSERITTGLRLQPDDQVALITAVRTLIGEDR